MQSECVYIFVKAASSEVNQQGREADFKLVLRSRKVELYLHSPVCLHGIVLN
jgi:hypothetical protein